MVNMILSRRKFIGAGVAAAAVAIAGTAYYIGDPKALAPYLCKPKAQNYDNLLSISQKLSNNLVEYPGINEDSIVTNIELNNSSDVPLENILVLQKASTGMELEFAKIGKPGQFERDFEPIQVKNVDDTVVYTMTEGLKPGETRALMISRKPGWETKGGDFQTTATGELYAEKYEPCWFTNLFGIDKEKVTTTPISAPPETVTVIPTPQPLREIFESGQKEWVRGIIKRKILMQYPVTRELQEKFWKDPLEYADKTIDYFQSELDKSGQPFNELSKELDKIPEIAGTAKYKVDKIDVVKGLENLAYLALLCDTPKESIVAMLDEGYPNVRQYCAPLQALIWSGRNELFSKENNPINPYDVEKLMSRVWFTSNEPPNAWEDFNVVTDRLNFPKAVSLYMFRNIDYSRYLSQGNNIDMIVVRRVFNEKRGNCADQAQFSAYNLKKNGYYARPFVDSTIKPTPHVACLFRDKDGLFYVHDPTIKEWKTAKNTIYGPFSSESSVKLIPPRAS